MKKEFKFKNTAVDVEYDESKFDISFIESEERIVVSRLRDGAILKTFTNIGFIVQTEMDGFNHFVVSDYTEYKDNNSKPKKLMHYIEYQYQKELLLENKLVIDSIWLKQHRIMDNVYLVGAPFAEQRLYNLKKESDSYKKVFLENDVMEKVNRKFVLVNRIIHADSNYEVSDLLTYGINPETYEIVTPIWSEMQQRSLNVYTDEEREQLNQKIRSQKIYGINDKCTNDEITIYYEIQKYLDVIGKIYKNKNMVYNESVYTKTINENFIKKFIKK